MSLRTLHCPGVKQFLRRCSASDLCIGLRSCRVYSLYVAPGRGTSASIAAPWLEATAHAHSRQRATELAWRRRAYNDNVVGGCGCGEGVVDEGLLRCKVGGVQLHTSHLRQSQALSTWVLTHSRPCTTLSLQMYSRSALPGTMDSAADVKRTLMISGRACQTTLIESVSTMGKAAWCTDSAWHRRSWDRRHKDPLYIGMGFSMSCCRYLQCFKQSLWTL